MNLKKLGLLPYQIKYLEDKSQIKIYEKSRQIGMTRTQALEDVIDTGIDGLYDTWFSSNNDLNAREYIRYCKEFAHTFNLIVNDLEGFDIVEEAKTYSIEFTNGKRITSVSSSPDQLHGKGGCIVLDEFARRENDFDTWEAAAPAALIWGHPIRIISTHNGKNTLFYNFIKKIESKELNWGFHKVTIEDAVNQGLADKVKGRKLSQSEREDFLNEIKGQVANPKIWAQQFLCIAQDESETFLPYALLDKNAKAELVPFNELKNCKTLYAGLDIGRFKNLSVLWIVEEISRGHYITRFVRPIHNEPSQWRNDNRGTDFPKQETIITEFMKIPNLRRLCVDKTGLGIGLCDYLQKKFGSSRVEGVTFTMSSKEVMAFRVQKSLQDLTFSIPNDPVILDDFNSIKQDTTSSGNIRLKSATNEDTGSHADYFWSAALALEASSQPSAYPEVFARKEKYVNKFLKHFKRLI